MIPPSAPPLPIRVCHRILPSWSGSSAWTTPDFCPIDQHALSVAQTHQDRRLAKVVVRTMVFRTVGLVGTETSHDEAVLRGGLPMPEHPAGSQDRTQGSHRWFLPAGSNSCCRSRHRAPGAGHRWSAPTRPPRRTDHTAGSRWHCALSGAALREWCRPSRSACRSRHPALRRCRERCSIGRWVGIRSTSSIDETGTYSNAGIQGRRADDPGSRMILHLGLPHQCARRRIHRVGIGARRRQKTRQTGRCQRLEQN